MKLILLFTLLMVSQAYYIVQSERGVDTSVHWAPQAYHVLQSASNMPRYVISEVKFQKQFSKIPQIVYSVQAYDGQSGQPSGFDTELLDITQDGFKIRYAAVGTRQLYQVTVAWFAFLDPNVQMFSFQQSNDSSLLSGKDGSRFLDYPINFAIAFAAPPQITPFLVGVQFQQKSIIAVKAVNITKTGFTLRVETRGTCKLSFVRVNGIIASDQTLYVGQMSFRADPNHRWTTQGVVAPITNAKFQSGERYEFLGVTGYEVDDARNQRFVISNTKFSSQEVSATWGTWADTQLIQLDANYFLYLPDLTTRQYDPECAEIFSECNYQGDSVSICDKVASFPKSGWNKPIKSYQIPPNMALKLYNQEDLQGKVQIISSSNPCVESLRFSLAQITAGQQQYEV